MQFACWGFAWFGVVAPYDAQGLGSRHGRKALWMALTNGMLVESPELVATIVTRQCQVRLDKCVIVSVKVCLREDFEEFGQ